MSEEERLLCPLCSASYADTASGRGMFKRHVRMAHLPKEKTFIRTFKQWDGQKNVDVAVHRYVCPFPDCGEGFISRERLWAHFRRKDHFRYILIKNKRF